MFKSKKEASDKASELLASLPSGWVPEVWQNIEWYFSLRKGPVSIHYSNREGKLRFFSMICDYNGTPGTGSMLWSTNELYDTPAEAAISAAALVRKYISKRRIDLEKHFHAIDRAMEGVKLKQQSFIQEKKPTAQEEKY